MSELAELHDEHNALFERYRIAHKQIDRLTKQRDELREALQFVREELQDGRVSAMVIYIDKMLPNADKETGG